MFCHGVPQLAWYLYLCSALCHDNVLLSKQKRNLCSSRNHLEAVVERGLSFQIQIHIAMGQNAVTPIEVSSNNNLCGILSGSGDKSISHRALIIAALSAGCSQLTGLLMSEDVRCTIKSLRQLGIQMSEPNGDSILVHGAGIGGLRTQRVL